LNTCALCGKEILDPRLGVAKQVVGWTLPRSSALKLRYETGALAHVSCVKYGGYEKQAQLWNEKQDSLWSG
jgi:hypothetical protein